MKGIGIKEVAFVGYPVTDMDRARDFYGRILGLEESWVIEDGGKAHWVEYEAAGTTVAIAQASDAWKPGADGGGACFEVDDLDLAVERLRAEGVAIPMPIGDFPMCRIALISDPDGNGIALHQKKPNHPECRAAD